ncbi:hypothetical protein B0J13DRAFT_522693 [Dactylonectria estremocensis]|uniref:Uncharacterized protein n=1 Tax=Dactylonectria estremocensis TaxID=1079267 RepID=A0A9P9J5Z4_9HYPO|nr:hypothetical protein B0J13DRAFT_522693 [Dactylonectria estremocensis]
MDVWPDQSSRKQRSEILEGVGRPMADEVSGGRALTWALGDGFTSRVALMSRVVVGWFASGEGCQGEPGSAIGGPDAWPAWAVNECKWPGQTRADKGSMGRQEPARIPFDNGQDQGGRKKALKQAKQASAGKCRQDEARPVEGANLRPDRAGRTGRTGPCPPSPPTVAATRENSPQRSNGRTPQCLGTVPWTAGALWPRPTVKSTQGLGPGLVRLPKCPGLPLLGWLLRTRSVKAQAVVEAYPVRPVVACSFILSRSRFRMHAGIMRKPNRPAGAP